MDYDYALVGGGVVAGGLMLNFIRNAIKETPGTHEPDHGNVKGGAAIAETLAEVETAGLTSKRPGGFFIAEVAGNKKAGVLLRFQQETGCLVFGGPRTGKGLGFVIPTLLDRTRDTEESLLVFDPAAQNVHVAGPYLQEIGYHVTYSNLSGKFGATLLKNFGAPVRMNPLGAVDIDAEHADLNISEVAAVLVPLSEADKSPFFAGTAQQLVAGIAIFLRETQGATATWVQVGEWVHKPAGALNELFARMLKESTFACVRDTAALWLLEIDERTKLLKTMTQSMIDVLTTARKELGFLSNKSIAKMFSGHSDDADAFDFSIMKSTRAAYFLVLPDAESEALRKCSYLVLRTAKNALTTPGGFTVLWLLDEMCSSLPAGAAALIRDSAAAIGKYRLRIGGVCQSWAQFENWSGGKTQADALRSMFGACIYYGANDNTSIKHIMEECGHYTVWQPASNPLHAEGIDGNSGPLGVPLFQPEDIRAMIAEKKQLVNLIGSRKAVLLPRSSYLDVPALKSRAAVDPYHLN